MTTRDELIRALEAAACEIRELGCTCVDRARCTPANVGAQCASPRATDVHASRSRQTEDYFDIYLSLARFAQCGDWFVVRRGRPGARIRVLYRHRVQEEALVRFTREQQRMRQGMLALVDPVGRIAKYASEPMVRTRW
jgi:hypothetical protein